MTNGPGEEMTLFDAAGGMPFFERLVAAFYDGVKADAVLRPMYPEDELDAAQRRLTLFLAQYWGGPLTYNEERGHPRLRMRHMPYFIGPTERDHWLIRMTTAVEEVTEPGVIREMLMGYFVPVADGLRTDEWYALQQQQQQQQQQ